MSELKVYSLRELNDWYEEVKDVGNTDEQEIWVSYLDYKKGIAQAKLDEREEIQRQLLLKGIDVNIVFQSTVTKPLEQRGKNDKNS